MTIRLAVSKLSSSLVLAAILPCAWLAAGCSKDDATKTDTTSTTSTQSQTTTPSASAAMTAPPPMGSGGAGMMGGRDKMMQAGVDACTGKAANDVCTMTDGSHTMTGKCTAPPAGATDTKLSCRPEGGPGGPGGHGDHGDHASPKP